jgi:uncharacterized protein (TIGR03086 family)
MIMPSDPIDLLSRVLDQTYRVFLIADGGNPSGRTPCRRWDLAALGDHVLHDVANFTTAAQGGQPDYAAAAPPVTGARAGVFRTGAEELLAAWRGQDLAAAVPGSSSDLSVADALHMQVAEFAVHGWDLAQATGTSVEWDQEAAGAALAWTTGALEEKYRGDESSGMPFGLEVSVPDDAPAQDRLVAWFGRDPQHPLG